MAESLSALSVLSALRLVCNAETHVQLHWPSHVTSLHDMELAVEVKQLQVEFPWDQSVSAMKIGQIDNCSFCSPQVGVCGIDSSQLRETQDEKERSVVLCYAMLHHCQNASLGGQSGMLC